MNIDPYKIPAFQRKGKPGTSSFTKSKLIQDSKLISNNYLRLLEKENQISQQKKEVKVTSVKPVSQVGPQATIVTNSEWRKMICVGEVSQYFDKINVAVLSLEKPLRVGDRILIQAENALFEQSVESMQINRKDVQSAKCGDDVGMKVKFPPLKKGLIYKLVATG